VRLGASELTIDAQAGVEYTCSCQIASTSRFDALKDIGSIERSRPQTRTLAAEG
jgi:hypothetical protein